MMTVELICVTMAVEILGCVSAIYSALELEYLTKVANVARRSNFQQ